MNLKKYIREFPDFPHKGISFKDISPILKNPQVMHYLVERFHDHFQDKKIDLIAGLESRGLIFASVLAARFKVGFIMIRKQGKLPGKTRELAHKIEYGSAIMEIQEDAIEKDQNVLIVDDLLATGGTASAAVELIELLGGKVAGLAFLIELKQLAGRAFLQKIGNYEIQILETYED